MEENRKPQTDSPDATRDTRVVVGLGNPGDKYRDTRHNLGFLVLEELASRRKTPMKELVCNAIIGGDASVRLATPQTYMNRSGYSARCLMERYELRPDNFLIVYDEVSLPLGKIRYRAKGSPGGHRGMESVVHNLRTEEIPRLRLGIGGEGGGLKGTWSTLYWAISKHRSVRWLTR